jgi:glycosyltransferase involved in cell wall biosynthesis
VFGRLPGFAEDRAYARRLGLVTNAFLKCETAPVRAARMQTVIVIPCLNEARLIARTAHSLGFGAGAASDRDTQLVLVDNGSTDTTWSVLETIREQAAPGTVVLAHEGERGYVPPRHRGTLIASEIAADQGVASEDVLILQGDADTVYEPGYLSAMRQAADAVGPNHVLEGRTHPPHRFMHDHPGFQQLADLVDREVAPLAQGIEDVVIDDKVAGYRLSDYQSWGGHRRDYMSTGAEVHAETTRLFIRARRLGAKRREVDHAWASPSRRKIQRNPVRHFATAGFPREEAWWRAWNAVYPGPHDLQAFDDLAQRAALGPAIAMRRAHLLALFSTLPKAVALSLDGATSDVDPAIGDDMLRYVALGQIGELFQALLPGPRS